MNPVRRFFRRYVFSVMGLLGLLAATNMAVLVILLGVSEVHTPSDTFQITEFCAHLTGSGDSWAADSDAIALLDRDQCWAMVLDPAGQTVWEYQMPADLPRSYTAAQIAQFSRWYLADWPVTVWGLEDGSLAVVGRPRGSMAKYYVAVERDYWDFLVLLACAIFYTNILLVVVLFLHSARRVEKAMGPILNAIRSLADGKPVRLREDGELAEINASLNRAAAYITQKDNTRAEWIRGISHDIRTPLSVMLGYASELEESDELPGWARQRAGSIRRQTERLTRLVADLNLTTRLEYALRPIARQRLDGAELARQAVSEVLNEGLEDSYSITFTEEVPGAHLEVAADPALMDRMLLNLLRNCIRHNPGGCAILVTVGPAPEGGCQFVIADDGVGVSPAQLRSLNRGTPLPGEADSLGEHGLGLRIVRQIVRAHKGRLSFGNSLPHGLTVSIWIGGPAGRL